MVTVLLIDRLGRRAAMAVEFILLAAAVSFFNRLNNLFLKSVNGAFICTIHIIYKYHYPGHMCVVRLFSRGGQNFPGGGGGKNILFAQKTLKKILFYSKKCKNILFGSARGGGGKGPLLPSPADAHSVLYISV